MKMSINTSLPCYSSETCWAFALNYVQDSPSILSSSIGIEVASPNTITISHNSLTSFMITGATKKIYDMSLSTSSSSLEYQCTKVKIDTSSSLPNNQTYDISTGTTTAYQMPSYSLNPSTPVRTIAYNDKAPVPEISFNTSTLTYDWSMISTVGPYNLTMVGSSMCLDS